MRRDRPLSALQKDLLQEAEQVAELLRRSKHQFVLAESCTGGLIASTLAQIPGISKFLCGSLVVYQDKSKKEWLGVSDRILARHGSVSAEVTEVMARQALRKTPHATLAAAITGHLGPMNNHVSLKDVGQLYLAVTFDGHRKVWVQNFRVIPPVQSVRSTMKREKILRFKRQVLASHALLFMVRSLLESAVD